MQGKTKGLENSMLYRAVQRLKGIGVIGERGTGKYERRVGAWGSDLGLLEDAVTTDEIWLKGDVAVRNSGVGVSHEKKIPRGQSCALYLNFLLIRVLVGGGGRGGESIEGRTDVGVVFSFAKRGH